MPSLSIRVTSNEAEIFKKDEGEIKTKDIVVGRERLSYPPFTVPSSLRPITLPLISKLNSTEEDLLLSIITPFIYETLSILRDVALYSIDRRIKITLPDG